MRKRLLTAVVMMMLTMLCAVSVNAYYYSDDNFNYSTNSDGTITISKYIGTAAEVTIPDTYNGMTVTSIYNYAFEKNTNITSVTVSDNVTSIGVRVFEGCTNLKTISMNSVKKIGSYAFYGCTNLETVSMNSLETIGMCAFLDCTNLKSVSMNSVKLIDYSAFTSCKSLTDIILPDSVETIGSAAFSNCTGITSIVIPKNVTSIGEGAFGGMTSLPGITVDESNAYFCTDSGILFNKDKTTLICYPAGKSGASYEIPNSVTTISRSGFSNCTGLTSITIPNSVGNRCRCVHWLYRFNKYNNP